MLHEEITKYRELSGDTNPNTPISRIGGYLDGYERALEQQRCEDTISREDVLMALTEEWTESTDELIHRFIKRIKKLPSVNPQQRVGHWIDREVYDADRWKCSECGRTEPYKENYCPNCGQALKWEVEHDQR